MLRMVARESWMPAATSIRSLRTSTMSALSMATSVPAPMAIPTSARASAGASLMPSPTMATLPVSASSRTCASLPSGRTPATTASVPTCCWMAEAVRSLSPVSMTVRTPIARSSEIAPALVGFTWSAMAIRPSSCPPHAKKSGVLPSSARLSARCSRLPSSMPASRIIAALPPSASAPSVVPARPRPATWRKSFTGSWSLPCSLAYAQMARASGCSLFFSRPNASMSRSPVSMPSAATTSVTSGSPFVMVPVLSSTTVAMSCAFSRASALLIRMPCFAPLPVPTMMAVGVARPSAQGQLMTSTAMPWTTAFDTSMPEKTSQAAKTTTAMAMTAGTNTALMRSARRWMGAFVLVASSTRRMMLASAVSSPTRVARILK